jgi:serine/threonine protein phosphatase PrpC
MECQRLAPSEVRTYLNAEMLEPEVFELAGGTAAVISLRRPEKTTANEDAAAIISTADGAAVLVVADGCGGMANGEAAARIAIECLAQSIAAAADPGALRAAILDGVEAANRQILDLKAGAGATLAVVQLDNGEARPYHVGDSQILLVGGRGKVKLLTTSHSPVGYAVQAGMLEESEAIDHEERHLVSNYLGSDEMHVEMGSGRKLAGRDGLLVASDGVLDNLLLDEIVGYLRSGSAAAAAKNIAALASQRMLTPQDGKPHKPDDLTLIVFTRRGKRPAPPAEVSPPAEDSAPADATPPTSDVAEATAT